MEIWYLDSGSLHGVPSVMNYEQTIKQIIETAPSWEKDGGGVRGRTIAPIISGASLSGGIAEFVPQQFNQQRNETVQRAREPIADLTQIDRGGGVDSCVGLALYKKTIGTTTQVWISAGTVAGDLPSGFDPAEGKSIAGGGSGNVWAEVNINGTTGDIVSVAVTGGGTTPNDTDTSFYYTLGNYSYTVGVPTITNYGCGSLDVTVCRNWFASEAPFYGVTINR